ncbi:MAG TPA: PilZ domain-containing protein, partial [Pyrinomonadaceae bacterium]
ESAKGLPDAPALVGFTRDLSETGLTLLLPSVRIGSAYLTDVESYLEVKLELPGGAVAIRTASVRFEQLPRREAGCGYLLAVRIVNMQNDERDRYVAFLKTLGKRGQWAREPVKAQAVISGSNNTAQTANWEDPTPASVSKAFEQFVRE